MRTLLACLFAGCMPVLAWSATIVVAPTGSNSNPCTATAPCQTLAYGASRLSGGDTLLVKPGTYAEALADVLPSGPSASQPTRLVSETPGGAILAPEQVPSVAILEVISKSNITIAGLVFDGGRQTQHYNVLVYIITRDCRGPMRNVTFQNNELRNLPTVDWGQNGAAGLKTGQYPSGGCLDAWENVVIRGNHIHHIAAGGTDNHVHGLYHSAPNVRIEGNEIDHVEAYGIQTFTTQNQTDDSVYTCNYIHDTNTRAGLMLGSGNRLKAMRNRVERAGGSGIDACVGFRPCEQYEVRDNVLVDNRGSCIALNGASGAVIAGNTCSRNGSDQIQQISAPGLQLGANQLGGAVATGAGTLAGCDAGPAPTPPPLPAPTNLRLLGR